MALPPPTITRRSGKILRSPIPQLTEPQSMPQPTEPPTDTPHDTDEDTYDNEQHTTPTPIRKRPSADTRIPQPPRASSPLLIDALIAQNMQIIESNRQMLQAFMQTMKRMAPSRRALPSPLPPQPIANPYDDTRQQIKELNETSKLVRPIYVKVKLANSRDWAKWSNNIRGYMAFLQMPDILNASYEVPIKGISECMIYNIQNTLLGTFILETVEQDYHYLLQEKTSI